MTQEKKVYGSFHDIPPRDYMYFPKGSVEIEHPGRFSRIEIVHILISILVLTVAFSFWKGGGLVFGGSVYSAFSNIHFAFVGVLTGFVFHEISHKFMAQKYGLWSEFRIYPVGIFLSLVLAVFTGVVFAAPGAVMFMGKSRVFETGRIAMAGPLANIVVTCVSFFIYFFVLSEGFLWEVFGFICFINALLAVFNLLPFGPLDGMKIIRWNVNVWIGMLIVSAVLTFFAFRYVLPVL